MVNPELLDKKFVWHPFTQMRDWERSENIVIKSGRGPYLFDDKGRKYLDGNSSIWTNLHGHQHPKINQAIQKQLKQIAHSSALGLANIPASQLAEQLINLAPNSLKKVFYSDDGSTALEAALKMAFQFWLQTEPRKKPRTNFLSLSGAYHGDTVGAMSVGGIEAFHKKYKRLLFNSVQVPSPYCYRCPYNRAKSERAESSSYRKCGFECMEILEKTFKRENKKYPLAAAVIEPLVQGAAGMIVHPKGYLKHFAKLCQEHDVPLILDEVMTGFGRTGTMFACEQEKVRPDFLCLAKGLTGGYLPMAATLTSQKIYNGFLGRYAEMKTFFHGHSYTGNQLGAAAALANLEILKREKILSRIRDLTTTFRKSLNDLWKIDHVGDIRQVGLVAGVEVVRNWKTRESYGWEEKMGIRICEEARRMGVITRPIGNIIVLMPPYCITKPEIEKMIQVIAKSVTLVCGK